MTGFDIAHGEHYRRWHIFTNTEGTTKDGFVCAKGVTIGQASTVAELKAAIDEHEDFCGEE